MTIEHHLTDAILAAIPADGSATSIEIAAKTGINRSKVISLLSRLESGRLVTSTTLCGAYRYRHTEAEALPETECENADLINS